MSKIIGEEIWDEMTEEEHDYYRGNQIPHIGLREVYKDYPVQGSVVDENDNLCKDYSLAHGRLDLVKIKVHYPEVASVPVRYDEHGYITRPGLIGFPEHDEEVMVSRFIPYTPEEQAELDRRIEEGRKAREREEAEKAYMMLMLPSNLRILPDDAIKTVDAIIPLFDGKNSYPEKSVVKFEGKNYRAKSEVESNSATPDKNDKWYEVK